MVIKLILINVIMSKHSKRTNQFMFDLTNFRSNKLKEISEFHAKKFHVKI